VTHPNIDLVTKLYGAFMTGDGEIIGAAMSPDITWHNSGSDPTAGELHGVPAVLDYLGADDHMDDYALDVVDMLASETRVAIIARASGRRGDQRFTNEFVQVILVDDGVVTEVWNYNWDQAGMAEFMSVPA
jgi:ketosteroid isomerase-like protein